MGNDNSAKTKLFSFSVKKISTKPLTIVASIPEIQEQTQDLEPEIEIKDLDRVHNNVVTTEPKPQDIHKMWMSLHTPLLASQYESEPEEPYSDDSDSDGPDYGETDYDQTKSLCSAWSCGIPI